MIKNLIGGIAVGIANVIPGVSGGTMMVRDFQSGDGKYLRNIQTAQSKPQKRYSVPPTGFIRSRYRFGRFCEGAGVSVR